MSNAVPEQGVQHGHTKKEEVKLLFAPGTETIMRNQLIGVFNAPQSDLVTTSQHNKIERSRRDEIEAIAKAERDAAKAKIEEKKTAKLSPNSQYKEFMANKLAQMESAEVEKKASEHSEEEALDLEEVQQQKISSPEGQILEEEEKYVEALLVQPLEMDQYPVDDLGNIIKSTVSAKSIEEGTKNEPEVPEATGSQESVEKKKEKPADWWNKPYTDDEGMDVEVAVDSVEAVVDKVKPKMYNVAVQVSPKDVALVYNRQPKPKMYDASTGVTPKDWAKVIKRPMDYEDQPGYLEEEQKQREEHRRKMEKAKKLELLNRTARLHGKFGRYVEIRGEFEWEGEEFLGEGAAVEQISPEELARREAERLRLERKPSLRADAYTLARPAFYRELLLATSMETLSMDKEVQVTEYDIEKVEAERRGVLLEENNILWPTAKQFTIEMGERNIEDYVRRCWKIDKEWMYHIRIIQVHTTDYRKKYIFEVIFSSPTRETPVPPATASVFFVFEVGKYSHIEEPIKVTYVLEGTRYPHIPGQIPFQDSWLHGIISDKLRIQRAIDF